MREHFAAKQPNVNGKHADDEVVVFGPECRLPSAFWEFEGDGPLGKRLRHIRSCAHAVQRSPTATFGVSLARMSAGMPHTVKLDAIVGSEQPLTIFTATVGASGSGKGDAAANAGRVFPAAHLDLLVDGLTDHLPPGSGQGLIEVLFDMVEEEVEGKKKPVMRKVQMRHNAFFEMDEGEALGALAGKDHILLESLRTIWSGKTVGQTNVEVERRRVLPAGTYTYGVNIQVQPTKAARLIEDDEGGTPQRFLWFPVMDPDIPEATGEQLGPCDWSPPGPMELAKITVMPGSDGGYVRHYLTQHPDITSEIRSHDLAVQRGEKTLAPLDAHALNLRRRIAGLLALLDGKLHVGLDHWELSAMVMTASTATRTVVLGTTQKVAADKAEANRSFQASIIARGADAVERDRIAKCRAIIITKVWDEPERWTVKKMREGPCKRYSDVFIEALDDAVELKRVAVVVIEVERTGTGKAKAKALRPGSKKP
jgi:hypothetical protein